MKYLKKFNEENNSELEVGVLKCDNCNWNDMSVPLSDYEASIGKPCPECGESLLTQDDYDQVMQMVQAVEVLNMYSEEDLEKLMANLSQEEIDGALDMMNKLNMKKKGQDEQGRDIYSIGENLNTLKKYVLTTRSDSGDDYIYFIESKSKPTDKEIDNFLINNGSDSYEGESYEDIVHLKELPNNFKKI